MGMQKMSTQNDITKLPEQETHNTKSLNFSKFTSTKSVIINGESKLLLGKEFNLVDGEIQKISNGVLIAGRVETISTPLDLLSIEEVIDSLSETQALGWGYNQTDCNYVFSSNHQARHSEISSVTRSKENFKYLPSPSVAMIDYDGNADGSYFTAHELYDIKLKLLPELKGVADLMLGSASRGIYKTDGEIPTESKGGIHSYIIVDDGTRIPILGERLKYAAWKAGYGYHSISKNGSLLARHLFDDAVYTPERLDFIAKPKIGEGISQLPRERFYVNGGILSTIGMELSANERDELEKLIATDKESRREEANKVKRAYKKTVIKDLTDKGLTLKEAREAAEKLISSEKSIELPHEWELKCQSDGIITVSDILTSPEDFLDTVFIDPLETHDGDKYRAKIYKNSDGSIVLTSYRHGRTNYILKYADSSDDDWEVKLENHVENFNNYFAGVMIGGVFKLMRRTPAAVNTDNREGYEFVGKEPLAMAYGNRPIKVGPKKTMNAIDAWLKHPKAKIYTGGVVFRPNRKLPEDYLNLWQGFTVEPKHGANTYRIRYHIEHIVCQDNPELIKYVYCWIAYTLQNPDKPAGSALICKGQKGSGKGTLGHFLRSLWGQHGMHITNAKHLIGNFNGHLMDCCFLFCDEAFYAKDKSHESVLKAVITEPLLTIERKGVDAVQQTNYLKVFMASNSEFTVPASLDERRYCVCKVSSEKIGDKKYFDELHADCNDKEIQAAFLAEMLAWDLSDYVPSKIPETEGLQEERLHSLNTAGLFLVDYLSDTTASGYYDSNGFYNQNYWNQIQTTEVLFRHYLKWCDDQRTGEYGRMSKQQFIEYLKRMYPEGKRIDNRRTINFGTQKQAIETFESYEKVNLNVDWNVEDF